MRCFAWTANTATLYCETATPRRHQYSVSSTYASSGLSCDSSHCVSSSSRSFWPNPEIKTVDARIVTMGPIGQTEGAGCGPTEQNRKQWLRPNMKQMKNGISLL
eukprot:GHVR01100156.1.p2 GENE.GHVR01100156.1~~GHVR01100156.1.p2  ORF type:complete len:104 (-),score=0.44 GHVR01100156.1:36-347(-)